MYRAYHVALTDSPDYRLAHAHNLVLQSLVELGIPGGLAFLSILALAAWLCWSAAMPRWSLRWLAAGLCCGLLAYGVYGLADTIAPGARGGFLLWPLLGLAAGLGRLAPPPQG